MDSSWDTSYRVKLEVLLTETDEVLTEGDLRKMEKAKEEEIAKGEISTERVEYLGVQATFYAGILGGVARIYQHVHWYLIISKI